MKHSLFTRTVSTLIALMMVMTLLAGCGSAGQATEAAASGTSLSESVKAKTEVPATEAAAVEEPQETETEPAPVIASVPITPENWNQYFEIVDEIQDNSIILDDTALYSFGLLYSVRLREHVAAMLDRSQNNAVTFDIDYKECTGLIRASYEGTSIYDEGNYAAVKRASAHVTLDPAVQDDVLITEQALLFTKPIDDAIGTVANEFQVTAVSGSIHIPVASASDLEVYALDNGMTLTLDILDKTHVVYTLDTGTVQQYITAATDSVQYSPDYQWSLDMYNTDGGESTYVSGITVSMYPKMDNPNQYVSLEDMEAYCQDPNHYYLTTAKVEQTVSGSVMTVRIEVPEDAGIDFTTVQKYTFYCAGKLEDYLFYQIPKNGVPIRPQLPQSSAPTADSTAAPTSAADFCDSVNALLQEYHYNLKKDTIPEKDPSEVFTYALYSSDGKMENVAFALTPSETTPGILDTIMLAGICENEEELTAYIIAASVVLFKLNPEYTDFETYLEAEIAALFQQLSQNGRYNWEQNGIQYSMLLLPSDGSNTLTLLATGLNFTC